jgi:uncharacterized damage-inducible protein DinB
MRESLIHDAFGHHAWATRRLLETCLTLSQDQRDGRPRHVRFDPRDGWHLVGSDAWYLFVLNGDRSLLIDEDQANLYELSAAMERTGLAWSVLLAGNPDSAAVVTEVDEDDGFRSGRQSASASPRCSPTGRITAARSAPP